MFNQKITFGKIQLNVKKDQQNDTNKSEDDAIETSGNSINIFKMNFIIKKTDE